MGKFKKSLSKIYSSIVRDGYFWIILERLTQCVFPVLLFLTFDRKWFRYFLWIYQTTNGTFSGRNIAILPRNSKDLAWSRVTFFEAFEMANQSHFWKKHSSSNTNKSSKKSFRTRNHCLWTPTSISYLFKLKAEHDLNVHKWLTNNRFNASFVSKPSS